MTALHTLGILSTSYLHGVVTWSAFQLTGVPCKKLVCGISLLLNAFEPQSSGGIQKIALFDERSSPYSGKNSSNKQREMTAHHLFQT